MSPTNPRVTKPLTTEQQDEALREALALFDGLLADDADILTTADDEQHASASADHLRKLFPDQDDRTLARFAAYVFLNLAASWSGNEASCPDLLITALYFGQIMRQLSALVLAPEAPEKP